MSSFSGTAVQMQWLYSLRRNKNYRRYVTDERDRFYDVPRWSRRAVTKSSMHNGVSSAQRRTKKQMERTRSKIRLQSPIIIFMTYFYAPMSAVVGYRPIVCKTFLFCKYFPPQPFLFLLHDSLHGFPRLFVVISEHICFLLFSFSVFTLFSCRFRAVD